MNPSHRMGRRAKVGFDVPAELAFLSCPPTHLHFGSLSRIEDILMVGSVELLEPIKEGKQGASRMTRLMRMDILCNQLAKMLTTRARRERD